LLFHKKNIKILFLNKNQIIFEMESLIFQDSGGGAFGKKMN